MSERIYDYCASEQGGRRTVDFPKEINGKSTKGKKYRRSVWKDGTVTYKEVTA